MTDNKWHDRRAKAIYSFEWIIPRENAMPTPKKKPIPNRKAAQKKDNEARQAEIDDRFPVVGIGGSAGGLEALEAFFSSMPPDTRIAFVVIQHLSPRHKSIMAELLARHTHLPVKEIEDGLRLAPGSVYINPPDRNVVLFNGILHLMETEKSGGINLPIDYFFRSLAEDQKEKAIGIIVSGTASDGTLGIKAIKGEGGMAMVQDPRNAKFDGMPTSAIETGLVDFIVPVEKMAQTLLAYINHPRLTTPGGVTQAATDNQFQVGKIYALIRGATGHDFSGYKPTTILRRIDRRLALHQIDKPSHYLHFLQKTPGEVRELFKDLLIGVTGFFRDPKAYEALAQKGLGKWLAKNTGGGSLRCWVPGCATGEEAYSLAILIAEAMETHDIHLDVQIFASDIDEQAIGTARKGIYPQSIAMDVSQARLKRYFTKGEGFYKVNKAIRDRVIFSLQSLIKDPPFPKLDLVSCRNLLIYLDGSLQKKIIPLFHYVLNPEGLLFLGSSETIGEFTDLFVPLDAKRKVYRRQPGTHRNIIDFPTADTHSHPKALPSAGLSRTLAVPDYQALAERALLDQLAPAGVLINENYEIVHFIGRTDKYLVPPTGKPSFNILNMARADLKFNLTAALHQAVREKKSVIVNGIQVRCNGEVCVLDLTVSPLPPSPELFLVTFEDKTPDLAPEEKPIPEARDEAKDPRVRQLEQELQSTREYLQATVEELETSNEELKSTNEEMQSVNEELQSANEELETSKEELQSTNEELNTVNAELQNKVMALSKAGDDMHNLLASTEIACVFLDDRLHIQRYTPAAARIIRLIPSDIGRPLNDLNTSFPGVDLSRYAEGVVNDLNSLELEIESQDHIWYLLRITPYRTEINTIEGVVMTLVNIQRIRTAEGKLRRLAIVVADSNDAVTVQNFEGRIVAWNKGAENMYGWTESEALNMNTADLVPEDRLAELQAFMDKIKRGENIRSFRTQRLTKSGKRVDVWLTTTALIDENGRPIEVATTERDLAGLPDDGKKG
jgi:two-component system CheB/CheR fusion protein